MAQPNPNALAVEIAPLLDIGSSTSTQKQV
jgi:hypothetical protein